MLSQGNLCTVRDRKSAILVLGLGNVLQGDDGAGIHVIRELQNRQNANEPGLPVEVLLRDGGTIGLSLSATLMMPPWPTTYLPSGVRLGLPA